MLERQRRTAENHPGGNHAETGPRAGSRPVSAGAHADPDEQQAAQRQQPGEHVDVVREPGCARRRSCRCRSGRASRRSSPAMTPRASGAATRRLAVSTAPTSASCSTSGAELGEVSAAWSWRAARRTTGRMAGLPARAVATDSTSGRTATRSGSSTRTRAVMARPSSRVTSWSVRIESTWSANRGPSSTCRLTTPATDPSSNSRHPTAMATSGRTRLTGPRRSNGCGAGNAAEVSSPAILPQ